MQEGDVARGAQALGEVVERQLPAAVAIERRARDERAQRPQRLEVARGVERDERVGLLRGRGPLTVDDDERTRPRARSRPNSRGLVTAGSARQTTTSSARSRISPNVAVLEPIAW